LTVPGSFGQTAHPRSFPQTGPDVPRGTPRRLARGVRLVPRGTVPRLLHENVVPSTIESRTSETRLVISGRARPWTRPFNRPLGHHELTYWTVPPSSTGHQVIHDEWSKSHSSRRMAADRPYRSGLPPRPRRARESPPSLAGPPVSRVRQWPRPSVREPLELGSPRRPNASGRAAPDGCRSTGSGAGAHRLTSPELGRSGRRATGPMADGLTGEEAASLNASSERRPRSEIHLGAQALGRERHTRHAVSRHPFRPATGLDAGDLTASSHLDVECLRSRADVWESGCGAGRSVRLPTVGPRWRSVLEIWSRRSSGVLHASCHRRACEQGDAHSLVARSSGLVVRTPRQHVDPDLGRAEGA
jgi:hypothetical protein